MATQPLTVTSYRDNPNGTTTNFLSDGSQDTGVLNPQKDGTATFSPISSDSLTPASPIKITDPVPATGATALGSYAKEAVNNLNTSITSADKVKADQQKKDSSLQDLTDSILGSSGQTTLADQAYKDNAVDTKKKTLSDINNKITAEDVATRHAIEDLQKNPQGLSTGALQSEVDRIKTESARRQADYAVVALSAQGDYFGAKEIADRAVNVELEKEKNALEASRLTYEDAKSTFTTDEQRQYNEMYDARKRELDQKATDAKTLSDTKLETLKAANENNAPSEILSAIQTAQTPEDVVRIAGQYGGDTLRKLQIAEARKKLNDTSAPDVKSINGVDSTWNGSAWVPVTVAGGASGNDAVIDPLKTKLNTLNSLIDSGSYTKVVGTGYNGRTPFLSSLTGVAQNAVADIHQLTSQETLKTLTDLKKAGGTLGALSEKELVILQGAASKINDWEVKDPKTGLPTGAWNANETDFKNELQRIKDLTVKALKAADPTFNVNQNEKDLIDNYVSGSSSTTPVLNPSKYY